MHARRPALELKLKCAHDLISIWEEGGGGDEPLKPSARPIVARNIVVAQVQSPRTHDLLSGYQHAISKD